MRNKYLPKYSLETFFSTIHSKFIKNFLDYVSILNTIFYRIPAGN